MKSHNLSSRMRLTHAVCAVTLAISPLSLQAAAPFPRIVCFGDSLSDTGNAYQLTGGFYPASPPNAEGRIGNGPLWNETLATSLGMTLRAEDQYAVAGARTDTGNFNVYFGLTMLENTGLQSQIAAYLQQCGPAGADPDALHTVWIGPNDIFTTLTFGGDMGFTVMNAVQNTAGAIVALASHGARHIMVLNLPDLGLTPFGLSLGPVFSAELSYLTDMYNAGLEQALDSLAAAGIPTIRLDTARLIREMAADPQSFGLTNVTDQLVLTGGNPDEYLFWNEVHPTTAGHRVVAGQAVTELVAYYSPRRGRGQGPGLSHSLNGLVGAKGR